MAQIKFGSAITANEDWLGGNILNGNITVLKLHFN